MAAPMDRSVLLGVFIEVRKQIRVAQVIMQFQMAETNVKACNLKDVCTTSGFNTLQVIVHPRSLKVIDPSNGSYCVIPLASIKVLPKTCNGLRWVEDEGLHMRLRLAETGEQGNQLETSDDDINREKEELEFLRSTACMVMCGTCRGKLVDKPCIFDRVLPLPSENWRELSESWCCHANEGTSMLTSKSLSPLENDCLVGSLYLLVHPSMLCCDRICLGSLEKANRGRINQGKKCKDQTVPLLCKRCRALLGEALASGFDACDNPAWQAIHTLKLHKHSIRIQSLEDSKLTNVFSLHNTESYLARYLASMSQMNATYKFIIESETDKQPYLLLWLLTTDSLLLTSHHASVKGAAESRFHGYQRNSRDTSRDSQTSEDQFKTLSVGTSQIVKVLYQTTWDEGGKCILQQWTKDATVLSIPLPKASCLELVLLLASSTDSTPVSLREMNSFKVGYLRL